jgi:hypothetical protein
LFCIDHMVSVDIQPGEDALIFDFQSIYSPVGNSSRTQCQCDFIVLHKLNSRFIRYFCNPKDDSAGTVTGFEAVMQVLHIILTDFKFEDDAFERAKQVLSTIILYGYLYLSIIVYEYLHFYDNRIGLL